jgi:hypothetical protein
VGPVCASSEPVFFARGQCPPAAVWAASGRAGPRRHSRGRACTKLPITRPRTSLESPGLSLSFLFSRPHFPSLFQPRLSFQDPLYRRSYQLSHCTMDSLVSGSVTSAFITTFIAWLLYVITQAVYRLYFSPIAKFPGPKLAAVSFW